MLTHTFLMAIGLVFIIEGLMPFLVPHAWRKFIAQMLVQNDKTLRVMGFSSMMCGVILIYLVH